MASRSLIEDTSQGELEPPRGGAERSKVTGRGVEDEDDDDDYDYDDVATIASWDRPLNGFDR